MKFYVNSFDGIVDETQQALIHNESNKELLESDNYYRTISGMRSRRPPISPVVQWNTIKKGPILDFKFTDKHLIILRKITTDWVYQNLTSNHNLYKDTLLNRTPQVTGSLNDDFKISDITITGNPPYIFNSPLANREFDSNYRKSYTFDITANSDIVAIDYYDKETQEFIPEVSTAFAIHKQTTSEVQVDYNNLSVIVPASNALTVLDHLRIHNFFTKDMIKTEPIAIAVYPNYISQFSDAYRKFIAPFSLSGSPEALIEQTDYRDMNLSDMSGDRCYMCYEGMPLTEIIPNFTARDLFANQAIKSDTSNINRLSLFQGKLTFLFCGLIYEIEDNVLTCASGNSLLPSVTDMDLNNFSRLPNPKYIDSEYDKTIPLRIVVKERGDLDYKGFEPLKVSDGMDENEFKTKYPEYAGILNYLSHVISYGFMGKDVNSNAVFEPNGKIYALPDVKFLQEGSDISAASRFISYGPETEGGFSAWFGLPTSRGMTLTPDGFRSFAPDPDGAYPNGSGLSTDGLGTAIGLFSKEQSLPYSSPTLANALISVENGEDAGIRLNHIQSLTSLPFDPDPTSDGTTPLPQAIFEGSVWSINKPSGVSGALSFLFNGRILTANSFFYVAFLENGAVTASGISALSPMLQNLSCGNINYNDNPSNPAAIKITQNDDGSDTDLNFLDIDGNIIHTNPGGSENSITSRKAWAFDGQYFIEKINDTYYRSEFSDNYYHRGDALPITSADVLDDYGFMACNGGYLIRNTNATTLKIISSDSLQLNTLTISLPSGAGYWATIKNPDGSQWLMLEVGGQFYFYKLIDNIQDGLDKLSQSDSPQGMLRGDFVDINTSPNITIAGTAYDNIFTTNSKVINIKNPTVQNTTPFNVTGYKFGWDGQIIKYENGEVVIKKISRSGFHLSTKYRIPTDRSNVKVTPVTKSGYWIEISDEGARLFKNDNPISNIDNIDDIADIRLDDNVSTLIYEDFIMYLSSDNFKYNVLYINPNNDSIFTQNQLNFDRQSGHEDPGSNFIILTPDKEGAYAYMSYKFETSSQETYSVWPIQPNIMPVSHNSPSVIRSNATPFQGSSFTQKIVLNSSDLRDVSSVGPIFNEIYFSNNKMVVSFKEGNNSRRAILDTSYGTNYIPTFTSAPDTKIYSGDTATTNPIDNVTKPGYFVPVPINSQTITSDNFPQLNIDNPQSAVLWIARSPQFPEEVIFFIEIFKPDASAVLGEGNVLNPRHNQMPDYFSFSMTPSKTGDWTNDFQVGNVNLNGIAIVRIQDINDGYTPKQFLMSVFSPYYSPGYLYRNPLILNPFARDKNIGIEFIDNVFTSHEDMDWSFRPITYYNYMWVKKKNDRTAYCYRIENNKQLLRKSHLDFEIPNNVINWITNPYDPDQSVAYTDSDKAFQLFFVYEDKTIRSIPFKAQDVIPDSEVDGLGSSTINIQTKGGDVTPIDNEDVKAITPPLVESPSSPYESYQDEFEQVPITVINDNCTIQEQNGRLRAYIYISYDYSHPNAFKYFDDKPLMMLPHSAAGLGNPYRFLIAGASGRSQNIDTLFKPNQDDQKKQFYPATYTKFLGYNNPYMSPSTANNIMMAAKEFVVQDSLNRSLKSLTEDMKRAFVVPQGDILKTLTDGNRLESTDEENAIHMPLWFSARASYFPLTGKQIIDLNARSAYVDGASVSWSDSASSDPYYFTSYLKNYFSTILNATTSATELAKIGALGQSLDPLPTDPLTLTFEDQEGRPDEVRQVAFLNDRILIHTKDGLHHLAGTLAASFSAQKFARVSLTTNIIADSSTIIGANDKMMYAVTYFDEYGGYTAYPINKKLLDLSHIDELVDFLRTKRLIFGVRYGSNVLYVLFQDNNRQFRGISKFFLPIRVNKVIPIDDYSILFFDINNRVYNMDFRTDFKTSFKDKVLSDDDLTIEDKEYSSAITVRNPIYINPETAEILTQNDYSLNGISIGIAGWYENILLETFDRSGRQNFSQLKLPKDMPVVRQNTSEDRIAPIVRIEKSILSTPYMQALLAYNNITNTSLNEFSDKTLCDKDIQDFYNIVFEEVCTVDGQTSGNITTQLGVDLGNIAIAVPEGI